MAHSGLSFLWWLVPIIILLTVLRSPWFKGLTGEALVRFAMSLRLPSEIYHPLHDITLESKDGTTQIDHIVVSTFGIFVIETKHMKGWIFGSENDPQWTQRIFRQSFKFQNPLRQNYKHTKALQELLQLPGDAIHSVVVFSGAATFKTTLPANVVRGGGYIRYIRSFERNVLSVSQVEEIVGRIRGRALPRTLATRRAHIQHLRSRQDLAADRKCPKCGSQMVVRIAKSGRNPGSRFWGCSKFPSCRTMQAID